MPMIPGMATTRTDLSWLPPSVSAEVKTSGAVEGVEIGNTPFRGLVVAGR